MEESVAVYQRALSISQDAKLYFNLGTALKNQGKLADAIAAYNQALELKPPAGLLIVDFINGFADPEVLGGGNVAEAIIKAKALLALAREWGWHITYTRVVYAEDRSDTNIFTEKVPGNLLFTEASDKSAVVPELTPQKGDLIIRKQFPSAFFGTNLASKLALPRSTV